ncbi:MAG: HIT family protein [Bacteroidales bacterium]|jgi:histidine triad (HIT) family protein|nr:HIT family protein [Bacteroidales bacterium]
METIFTKIIKGEIPCYKVAENDQFFAFLDVSPLAKGHTLVVPKIQNDYIFDLEDATLSDMIVFSKKIAKAIEKTIPCLRIGVAVIGLEVPHTHIHLVPLNQIGDLDFKKEKLHLSKEEMSTIASQISSKITV